MRKKMHTIIRWPNSILLTVLLSMLSGGRMSIHTAARAGNLAEIKRQLAWGVNPNTRTFPWYLDTPLHFAAADRDNVKQGESCSSMVLMLPLSTTDARSGINSSRPLSGLTNLKKNKDWKHTQ